MKLQSQPRIKRTKRIPSYSGMHPDVKYGIKSIARKENKSVSWVIAEIVSEFFGIDCMTGKKIHKRVA